MGDQTVSADLRSASFALESQRLKWVLYAELKNIFEALQFLSEFKGCKIAGQFVDI